ncbi:helix-turn-helix domain-containing protein [Agromyces sp. LHK192]|uniref:helix-turn-helix domain-containing protein n=1 Tax=Agromyces sp. LHK192 TaxID=2498704 RepID=UPI000FD9AC09|nr:helix-turn-helix domain-containing protein [Agromyces sp. LHK192]
MPIDSDHRGSDSRYVARVWRGRTSGVERMTSIATSTWELVFWDDDGVPHAGVLGPETAASTAVITGDSASFGITFEHGTWMPHLPIGPLVDGGTESPHVTGRRFVLRGAEWEIPDFDTAEQFVDRLVREGVLMRDPLVGDVVRGENSDGPGDRSVQRRVAAATGLTRGAIRQIERARAAAVLLRDGAAPLETVHRTGFYDQAHLARALRRFIGRTATQLRSGDDGDPLSLLYKPEADGRS